MSRTTLRDRHIRNLRDRQRATSDPDVAHDLMVASDLMEQDERGGQVDLRKDLGLREFVLQFLDTDLATPAHMMGGTE